LERVQENHLREQQDAAGVPGWQCADAGVLWQFTAVPYGRGWALSPCLGGGAGGTRVGSATAETGPFTATRVPNQPLLFFYVCA